MQPVGSKVKCHKKPFMIDWFKIHSVMGYKLPKSIFIFDFFLYKELHVYAHRHNITR